MNDNHAKLCPSPEWADHIQNEVLPPLTAGLSLGRDLLEIGPGPGAATEWLRHRVDRLTAIEVDPAAAGELTGRFAGSNVEIVTGDATRLAFADSSFDSVGTFTMLHHVPTVPLQFRVLAEAFRVLRPGGVLFGSDSLASSGLGFGKITIAVDDVLTFTAHRPEPGSAGCGRGGRGRDCEEEAA
jgi:SAM-dependent methyltransferase